MVTSLYSEPIPVTEITSDWRKFHFPRDSRVITCVNLNLVRMTLLLAIFAMVDMIRLKVIFILFHG